MVATLDFFLFSHYLYMLQGKFQSHWCDRCDAYISNGFHPPMPSMRGSPPHSRNCGHTLWALGSQRRIETSLWRGGRRGHQVNIDAAGALLTHTMWICWTRLMEPQDSRYRPLQTWWGREFRIPFNDLYFLNLADFFN